MATYGKMSKMLAVKESSIQRAAFWKFIAAKNTKWKASKLLSIKRAWSASKKGIKSGQQNKSHHSHLLTAYMYMMITTATNTTWSMWCMWPKKSCSATQTITWLLHYANLKLKQICCQKQNKQKAVLFNSSSYSDKLLMYMYVKVQVIWVTIQPYSSTD